MASFHSSPPPPPSLFTLTSAPSRFNLSSSMITPSIGAMILAAVPKEEWADKQERKYVRQAVKAAQSLPLPSVSLPDTPRGDTRSPFTPSNPTPTSPLKIYTDYPLLSDLLKTTPPPYITLLPTSETADFLFLVTPLKDFINLNPNTQINQFPYEGGLVQKDLLPLTLRRYCPDLKIPETYDLSTEFHYFVKSFGEGEKWIIKESTGTHSQGLKVISSLKSAAEFISSNPSKSYITQKIILNPLLVSTRKFDLRVWCFIRSFGEDFEGYMSNYVHARVSNKPYNVDELEDEEVFLTIATYNESVENGERLTPGRLRRRLEEENEDFKWNDMIKSIHNLASTLFNAVAPSIGNWPRSRAYYGLDVIITVDSLGNFSSNLLEVNFAGDFDSARETQRQAVEASEGLLDDYDNWLADLFSVLFTSEPITSPRLQKL
ncbi:hypothetical protein TrLO_g13487 [Triparma laevis f. longispina]|uniref:Tubulin-tyrosine ligase n=1 Tax=Triparma laevis f. longispina TaxID=1714387 RepID=A0A9W7B4L7_9STRA|nr:hypothetical protein TrLO_g13487 [Triparma laevis f. longispina]